MSRGKRRDYPRAVIPLLGLTFIAATLAAAGPAMPAAKETARLEVTVVEGPGPLKPGQSEGVPLPCRIHLASNGQPVYAPGCPRWERDRYFCCEGRFSVAVPAGKIELLVERGPEWESHRETFDIEAGTTKTVTVALSRWMDMNARGWFSGDLHVHRPLADMPLLLRAEDLNVAPDLTFWNAQKGDVQPPYLVEVKDRDPSSRTPRFYHALNQEDERIGGAILIFNLRRPIVIENVYRYWPSGMAYHRVALEQDVGQVVNLSPSEQEKAKARQVANLSPLPVHVEQEKPFWWEAPVNVALGKIASMEIVHNHFHRAGLMENEAWGRPRDPAQYPGPLGFALYTLDLYYRYLNLGWDIPASAGSASGVLANPLGYCRVYAQMDCFDYAGWFEALRAGRNFVTNGPMLFATVNGRPIGTHFEAPAGKPFEAAVRFEVLCREPLDRAEIVVGGKVVETVRPAAGDRKRIAAEHKLALDRSTWIAVRAFEDYAPTLRFAHTSPFYVAIGGEKRRDSDAAKFYVQWMDDLMAKMEKERASFRDEKHLVEVLALYKQAREVYAKLAGQ